MTFATELLARHMEVAGPQIKSLKVNRVPVRHIVVKRERHYRIMPADRIRKEQRDGPVRTKQLHMARIPGVRHEEWGWAAMITVKGYGTMRLGNYFKTWQRARVAVKLYDLWLSRGFTPDVIPRGYRKPC